MSYSHHVYSMAGKSLREKQLHHVKVSVAGLAFLHAPNSLSCKAGVWWQWEFLLDLHRVSNWDSVVGERQTATVLILPHRQLGSLGKRCCLRSCLRRHAQTADNIRMQLCEGDRDRETSTLAPLSGKTWLQGRRQNTNTAQLERIKMFRYSQQGTFHLN